MSALAAHYTPEHQMFRETCRRFFEKEVTPFHMKWEEDGIVPRELWRKAGEQGLLGMTMPEAYGGAGADFLYSAILIEEQGRALASGPAFSLHNDIVVPYLLHYGSEEQKKKWIPKAIAGELITAIAMTEPGTGLDLQSVKTNAVMDGNHWVINGSKVFISGADKADFGLLFARTDPEKGRGGVTCFIVETSWPGFHVRRVVHTHDPQLRITPDQRPGGRLLVLTQLAGHHTSTRSMPPRAASKPVTWCACSTTAAPASPRRASPTASGPAWCGSRPARGSTPSRSARTGRSRSTATRTR